MTDKKKIDVVIDGRNFTVVGSDNEEYIRELARYVDKNIKNLATKNHRLSPVMTATLAAFNIADELFSVNKEHKDLEKRAKEPLEKYEITKKEIETANNKIKELERRNLDYNDEVIKIKISKEELFTDINRLEEEVKKKDEDIEQYKKEISTYKDRQFKTQIEIIELKKQLKETLEINERI
ncbi:MAG: cell division protein ZapA [Gudongella sp.]|nr:cell division protein ZapA [Gudongella sp.]